MSNRPETDRLQKLLVIRVNLSCDVDSFFHSAFCWIKYLLKIALKFFKITLLLYIAPFLILLRGRIVIWTQKRSRNLSLGLLAIDGMTESFCVRWNESFDLMKSVNMETSIWTLYIAITKFSAYMQNCMMLLEQSNHKLPKGLASVTRMVEAQLQVCPVTWLSDSLFFHVKLFKLFFFEFLSVSSILCCIILGIKLADENFFLKNC